MSYYRNQLENWLANISVNSERVLDLGGASNPVRTRVNTWNVEDCVFFDNGAEAAKVDYIPFDINLPVVDQLKGYESYFKKIEGRPNPFEFDAIFCLEVFEYVWNPVQAITNIWEMMSKDSITYISFPAIYPVHQPWEIDCLRYTQKAIEKYLSLFPFQQIEITPRVATQGKGALSQFYSQEGMHPLRGSQLPYDIGYLVKARRLEI